MNKSWSERIDKIKSRVTMRQIVDYFNMPTISQGIITQMRCPFHGNDLHASARIYETNSMYCWVCTKSWDVISFVKDYKDISFPEACSFLENNFNIERTAYSYEKFDPIFKPLKKEIDLDKDFERIQNCLIINKDCFQLEKYVEYFYYYDNLYYNYKSGHYFNDQDLKMSLDLLYKEVKDETSSAGSRGSVFSGIR